MFVTTIAALIITAYNVFAQIANTPNMPIDGVIGNVIAGVIAIFLVIAALILAWDAMKAFQRFQETAPAKA